MASWQTCLTMRAKQSCWAAGRAQYFIRLQSLNRQLSTDHVIRPHQRDSIDSCSFKLSSVLDDWVQPVQKPRPPWWFNVSLPSHLLRQPVYGLIWSTNQRLAAFFQLCVDESCKCTLAAQFDNDLYCLFLSGVFFWHFKLAYLLYFLFPGNLGLGFEVHQRTVASRSILLTYGKSGMIKAILLTE